MSTKVGTVHVASQSCGPGNAVIIASGFMITSNTGYGMTIFGQITNGASAPTTGCTMTIQHSIDAGTTWVFYSQQSAGIAPNTTYSFAFDIPPSLAYVRAGFGQNLTNAVTIAAQAENVTGA